MTLTRSAVALAVAAFGLLFPGPAAGADTHLVRGRVVKTDPAAKTVTVRPNEGADVTLAVTDASRLEVGGKPATVAQLKEGQRVRVSYTDKTNQVVSLKPAVTTEEDLRREVKQALGAARDYTFRQKDKYEARLRGTAEDVQDRIDYLEARAKDAGAEAKERIRERIAELRKKKGVLNDKLDRVGSATADAWEDVKSGVGAAADDLQKALDRVFRD
jgi:hypothetical protein